MGDQHDHGHHEQSHSRASSAFRWSIALNSVLTALQLVVGFAFGSLALIGDALHNLGDVVGLGLGWGADRCGGRRFQLSALRRSLGATGATVVDGLGSERTLAALHQHGHQQFFGAGCRAEGVQSRPVGGTTDPMPLCQIAAVTPSFQEFFQNSNPIRVVRFHPLSPPLPHLPHLLQFPFASSTSPIHLM